MIALLLGVAALLAMMAALGMFSRARIATIKAFGAWFAAIAGLALACLLFFTGRGGVAVAALVMLAPTVWTWLRPAPAAGTSRGPRPRSVGRMSRAEAFAVLGLPVGASDSQIQVAYVARMRAAHPDHGGSDWLASQVNQARDTLLG